MSDAMTKLEITQSKLPRFYKKNIADNSVLYGLLKVLTDESNTVDSLIDRVDCMIGVDTTYDEDLEYRWGSLLSVYKKSNESYSLYRNELKLYIPSLVGGTHDTIVYAIAVCIGIENNSQFVSDYIEVHDAWDYTGDIDTSGIDTSYGNFLCIIDMSVGEGAVDVEQEIINSVKKVKASGTNFHIFYKAFKILMYYEMEKFNYDSLASINYDDFGV